MRHTPAAGNGTADASAGDDRPTRSPSRRARGLCGAAGRGKPIFQGVRAVRRAAGPVALLGALALAGAALLACGEGGAESATPVATDRVLMPPHYRFDPPAIRVEVGDTVTWVNQDDFTHSVRLEGEGDRRVAPGDSVAIAFTEIGEHPYDCSLHPHDMSGRVIVGG